MLQETTVNWKELFEKRKVKTFYELPDVFQEKILRLVKAHPELKIYLTGSFAKGWWSVERNFEEFRNQYLEKYKDSDLDLITEPYIMEFEDIDFQIVNATKLLIYNNYEFF